MLATIRDIYFYNLRQNCVICFNRLIKAIIGCNMNRVKAGT